MLIDYFCKHYFYNLVDPAQVNLYGRPPNATNEALWQKAVRENPDRSCLVPVVAIGFDDLRQRVEAQSQQAASHHEKLKVSLFKKFFLDVTQPAVLESGIKNPDRSSLPATCHFKLVTALPCLDHANTNYASSAEAHSASTSAYTCLTFVCDSP
jgi:hypothetical protein